MTMSKNYIQLTHLFLACIWWHTAFIPGCNAWVATQIKASRHDTSISRRTAPIMMAVTPIGPFCPFRSEAAVQMEPKMSGLNTATPEFAMEMARIQYDLQIGNTPDPAKLREVASGIEGAVGDWENLLTRLRISQDFQTREYAKLTQAHLESHGQTTEGIAKMMRWQAGCMRAMADNTPPPMPPPDMNIMQMMTQANENKQNPSINSMSNAEYITTTPFTGKESAFESDTVREEYEKLCRDHAKLIDMGAKYAEFDPLGKIAYLDMIENIQERWDVFFARFSLLGALNQKFIDECNAFLETMGLDESEFRDLLKKAHKLMREDAESERGS